MTTPTCHDVAPLLELYAAGECAPAEGAQVDSHLRTCPVCTRSVAELRDVVGLLDLEYRTPGLLANLGARLEEVERERERPGAAHRKVAGVSSRRPYAAPLRLHRAALSLAALLLVTLGLSNTFPPIAPAPDVSPFPSHPQ